MTYRKPRRNYCSVKSATNELRSATNDIWRRYLTGDAPSTIYKYCDKAGMRGMIKNHNIWATDAFTMNDRNELSYGHGVAARIVAERTNAGLPVYLLAKISEREDVRRVWSEWCTHLACFSASAEIKSQWSNYADQGRGFALGFDRVHFERSCHSLEAALFPVVYDMLLQEGVIKEYLRSATEIKEKFRLSQEARTLYDKAAISRLASLIITLKDPKYKDEQEWRIQVVQTSEEITFTPRTHPLGRCYFELPLCTVGTLSEIILGTENPSDFASTREFAKESGFTDVLVRRAQAGSLR